MRISWVLVVVMVHGLIGCKGKEKAPAAEPKEDPAAKVAEPGGDNDVKAPTPAKPAAAEPAAAADDDVKAGDEGAADDDEAKGDDEAADDGDDETGDEDNEDSDEKEEGN